MSAESIARWNAIPLTRPENPGLSTLSSVTKRPRDDDEDEHDEENKLNGDGSDDDVSLVSRSPSPVPQDQMDIDKYDDYVRGPVREVITTETKIKETNKGFMMLSKLGWVEGQCLGLSQDARIDPLPFRIKNDATGLGKTSQDFRMIETTVSQRRELDSERQRNETEEQKKAREGNVARRAALQTEISEVLRPFYCTVCDKQFQNVAQYDEHTNSYAHHHKIRFRDMQTTQRAKQNTAEEQDKRKEKERKREEKELRKIAAAAGVKVAKTATSSSTVAIPPVAVASSSTSTEPKPSGFKKGSWASISSANAEQPPSTETELPPARTGGWASVGSSSVPSSHSASPPAPDATTSSSGGFITTTAAGNPAWSSQPRDSYVPSLIREQQAAQEVVGQRQLHQPAPAFRTGGWSSIDSTTRLPPQQQQPPPLPPQPKPPSAAPPPIALRDTTLPTSPMATATANVRGPPDPRPSGSTSTSAFGTVPAAVPSPVLVPPRPQASIANPDPTLPKPSKSKKKEREAEMRENSRSGWQNFQKGGRRK